LVRKSLFALYKLFKSWCVLKQGDLLFNFDGYQQANIRRKEVFLFLAKYHNFQLNLH